MKYRFHFEYTPSIDGGLKEGVYESTFATDEEACRYYERFDPIRWKSLDHRFCGYKMLALVRIDQEEKTTDITPANP